MIHIGSTRMSQTDLQVPQLADHLLCPNCRSSDITRDSASPWIFVFAIGLFPLGLFFFFLNKNVHCRNCGVRFKRKA